MKNLSVPREIRSPGQLSTILREIKVVVTHGALEPVKPDIPTFASEFELTDIPSDGPWPDYFELCFREIDTGQRYKLSVETYHGAGGTWAMYEG